MSQNKKVYLEAIRVIAVVLVIFNHTDGFVYYRETENGLTWIYSMVLAIICRTAVPLFFMVSGALLLEKEESFSVLFKKRIFRILLVLVIVSLGYYFFDMGRGRIVDAGAADFLIKLLTNGIRESFWFLYAYLAVLLTLPFFRKLAPRMNKQLIIYLIILKAVSELLVPFVNLIFGISITFDIGFVGSYIYYMLLGFCLIPTEKKESQTVKTGILWLCFGGLLVFNMAVMGLLYKVTGEYPAAGLDFFVFLTAPLIWMIMQRSVERIPGQSKINQCIIAMGSCVFGIYLLDNFIRWQLLPVYLFLSEKTVGVLACSVYVILVFIIGFLYTWILKKIPVIKRFL